jgi:peptide/nickel transport system substrate-binding protein
VRNHLKRSTWSVILAVVGIAAIAAAIAATATAKGKAQVAASSPIQVVAGTPPQSLDPSLDYTTQGSEVNWEVYTGLLTYAHANGAAGAKIIPGLATGLPKIGNGGKTYTFTLRSGQKFSNGDPVVASDFTYTLERMLSIPWGGASTFDTPYIVGASAYATHKAKGISGVVTNDSTGKIVIHLTKAYGPFENVLAFPSLGLLDPKTAPMPFKVQASNPPAGDGPFMVNSINPGVSFNVVPNPNWKALPGIAAATQSFSWKINSNVEANALSVLNNSADIFDWADTVPGSLLPQINSKAKSRYNLVNLGGSVYYFFMNYSKPPFNNQDAREAVVAGLNEAALNRLGAGTLKPACYFLPPALPGHPSGSCPFHWGTGDLKLAKKLVKESGQANVPITVYSEQRTPRLQWCEAYAKELQQIGFKHVTLKQVADANYFTTIGESKKLDPQTGFADWNQDFPNPVDFYGVLLDGNSITPTNNENFGQTNDKYVNTQVNKLGAVPVNSATTKGWQNLDKYVANHAYAAVFGYQTFPFFTSDRIKVSFTNSIYGWDLLGISAK